MDYGRRARSAQKTMIYPFGKRIFDVVVSVMALIFLAPLVCAIGFAIKVTSQGPIFYRGRRAGLNGVPFDILKFRTMVIDAEKKGGFSTALSDPRVTGLGRFLRRWKLDEIPQFYNVLRGQMSLVGPRPQVLYYTDLYVGDQLLMLSVRPGITDLASLHFADMDSTLGEGDVDKKYAQEIEPIKNELRLRYVREASFMLDLRIIIETAFRVIGLRGVTRFGLDSRA